MPHNSATQQKQVIFDSIKCIVDTDDIGIITLHRPEKHNALNATMRQELFRALDMFQHAGVRAIIVHAMGAHFCSGIDMQELVDTFQSKPNEDVCQARHRIQIESSIKSLQESMTQFERVPCPVIGAVHGCCIGAGIDLITACDIRFCTVDARFCVKEVDLGIPADMGTLSRLPPLIGYSNAAYYSLTAKTFDGQEALSSGLVSQVFKTQEQLLDGTMACARDIARKSPVAVAGTKKVLLYARSHPNVDRSLEYVAMQNAALLPGSKDLEEVLDSRAMRRSPRFSKL